jgi:hypothetical protein
MSVTAKKTDYYKWIAGIALPIVLALIGYFRPGSSDDKKTPGNFTFIGSVSVIENQYQQFVGQPMKADVKAQLTAAVNLANAGQYEASRRIFEQMADAVPVPAVYSSIGAFYAEKGDSQHAREFYQKAVAKDPTYKPALANLTALTITKPDERPISGGREAEPNNDIPHANVLPLGSAVAAEIADASDSDYYRLSTGPTRDIYRASVKNLSTTLAPAVTIYDAQKNNAGADHRATAGADLDFDFAPEANATVYVQVSRYDNVGAYSLTVAPLHRYDAFEPNDDIQSAKPLALGKTIDANIMDAQDRDFYQITSGAAGNLTVMLKNTSSALAPTITLYDGQKNEMTSDHRASGGADLSLPFAAQANSTYYVQISRYDGSGTYSLTVK